MNGFIAWQYPPALCNCRDVLVWWLSALQVVQAKFLASVTVMLLASFEHPANGSTVDPLAVQYCSCSSGVGSASARDQQQEVNPHPPFRGVLRDALHAAGLFQPLLDLVMHSKPGQERRYRSSCFGDDTELSPASRKSCSIDGSQANNPATGADQQCADDNNNIKALLIQVSFM